MNRIRLAPIGLGLALALSLPAAPASAGGIQGFANNLPKNGLGRITGEPVTITARETSTQALLPLIDLRAPAPAPRVAAVTTNDGEFAIAIDTGGVKREVDIAFTRPDQTRQFEAVTRVLSGVVIDGGPRALTIDVTVPQPATPVYCPPQAQPKHRWLSHHARLRQ